MSHFRPLGSPGYSPRKTIKPVHFICLAPEAKQVTLSGDFNDWHPTAAPMKHIVAASWHVDISLPPGHHHYHFLVDGKPVLDPRAQGNARNERGEKVSMVAVS